MTGRPADVILPTVSATPRPRRVVSGQHDNPLAALLHQRKIGHANFLGCSFQWAVFNSFGPSMGTVFGNTARSSMRILSCGAERMLSRISLRARGDRAS